MLLKANGEAFLQSVGAITILVIMGALWVEGGGLLAECGGII